MTSPENTEHARPPYRVTAEGETPTDLAQQLRAIADSLDGGQADDEED